jgi:hypothetical protein
MFAAPVFVQPMPRCFMPGGSAPPKVRTRGRWPTTVPRFPSIAPVPFRWGGSPGVSRLNSRYVKSSSQWFSTYALASSSFHARYDQRLRA